MSVQTAREEDLLDPIHEARYWAVFASLPDDTPGVEIVRDALIRWMKDAPETLRPDAATFLLVNAIHMYLKPLQGADTFVGVRENDVFGYLWTEYGSGDIPPVIETVAPVPGLHERILSDLDVLLNAAKDRAAELNEPLSAHEMLRVIDAHWQVLQAWWF